MPINNKFDLFASFSPEIRNSPKEHHNARVLPLVRWIENSRRRCRQRVFSVSCFELNPYDDTGLACKIVVTARTRRDFAGEHDLRQWCLYRGFKRLTAYQRPPRQPNRIYIYIMIYADRFRVHGACDVAPTYMWNPLTRPKARPIISDNKRGRRVILKQ